MKTAQLLVLALACTLTARADFSYVQTRKTAQGRGGPAMGGAAGDQTTKHYLKGQKMKMDNGTTATIFDLEAQTVTSINHSQKTYTVTRFSDIAQTLKDKAEVTVDVKETGQRKSINGFNASQVMMTMMMEGTQGPPGMKMQMEVETWLSSDVPGASEARAFYQKNGSRLPWGAMAGGADPSMQQAMSGLMKKMSTLGGVPVMQVVRMKMAGGGADPRMAQIEAMRKQGGKQAEMAEQMAGRMGGMGGGGSLFEVTTESSGFSAASIPDSVFAIPDGYQKK